MTRENLVSARKFEFRGIETLTAGGTMQTHYLFGPFGGKNLSI
jgi:hypothetical protein